MGRWKISAFLNANKEIEKRKFEDLALRVPHSLLNQRRSQYVLRSSHDVRWGGYPRGLLYNERFLISQENELISCGCTGVSCENENRVISSFNLGARGLEVDGASDS